MTKSKFTWNVFLSTVDVFVDFTISSKANMSDIDSQIGAFAKDSPNIMDQKP